MGLLGQLLGGNKAKLVHAAGSLIGGGGGLGGLLQALDSNGLGQVGSSWVSTGSNLPISAEQLQKVLGSDQLASIAGKLGMTPDKAAHGLSKVLPGLVDRLTPDGKVPDAATLEGALAKVLGR